MSLFTGSCHCGAVRFSFEGDPISKGIRCNCSLCSRKGAVMSPEAIAEDELTIEAAEDALGIYQFGARTAKHFFCRTCGIYTFHETARFPGYYRVNVACLEGVDPFALEVEVFDGRHLL